MKLLAAILIAPALLGQIVSADYAQAVDEAERLFEKGDMDAVITKLSPWAGERCGREACHGLGLAYYEKKDFPNAIRHQSAAMKLEPPNSAVWKQTVEILGMAYYFNNRPQDALPLLAKAMVWNPKKSDLRYTLAMCYVNVSDRDNARRNFAALFGIAPESPQAFLLAADVTLQEKRGADASALILEAMKRQPGLPEVNYRLALVNLEMGDYPKAVKLLKQELDVNPSNSKAWYWLGSAYVQSGKLDDAVGPQQRSIWLNLRSVPSYVLLADVCFQQGKFPAAENALQRALEMDPQNYEAHFQLARVYYKMNRLQRWPGAGVGRWGRYARRLGTSTRRWRRCGRRSARRSRRQARSSTGR
jgi:tetratricopeptide (TPR) repeat protein